MNLLSRRFPTILGIILLTVLSGVGWWFLSTRQPEISSEVTPSKIRITNVADNKFTVSWTTNTPLSGYVEYGVVGETLSQIAYDDRDNSREPSSYLTHHVTVANLQPSTQYAFRIVSGATKSRFDNNGTPYLVTTGPTIETTPIAKSIYGEVDRTSTDALGAIVYLTLPNSAPVSTLVTSTNNYSFTLSTIRTSDLESYIEYDASATIASLTVENGTSETLVTVTTANAEPVPKILLGQNADYRTEIAPIAQVEPVLVTPSTAPSSPTAAIPGIFNVQPLGSPVTTVGTVTLTNPAKEGETIATTKPEFRGTGPAKTVLSLRIQATKPQTGNVTISANGTWTWTPTTALQTGSQSITVSYVDGSGNAQTLTRSFIVSTASAGDPAFVSTPSAQLASASPSPSVKASATASSIPKVSPSPSPYSTASAVASPREVMPSTESGVPVTGLLSPTLLTAALGFVIMIAGALMLAL